MPKKYRNPYRKGTPQNPYKTKTTKKTPDYSAKLEIVEENIRSIKAEGFNISAKELQKINEALYTSSGSERKRFTKEQKKTIDKYSRKNAARNSARKRIIIDKFYGQNDSIEISNVGTLEISQRANETEYEAKMRHAVEVLNRKKDILEKGGTTETGMTLIGLIESIQILNPGVLNIGDSSDIKTYDLSNYKNLDFSKPVMQGVVDKLVGLTSMSEVGHKAQRTKQARKYRETAGLSDLSADFLDTFLSSSLYMARNFAPERYKTDSLSLMHDELKEIAGSENKAAKDKIIKILKSYDSAAKRSKNMKETNERYTARLEKAIEEAIGG